MALGRMGETVPELAAINVTDDLRHELQHRLYRPPQWVVADEVQVPTPCGSAKRFLDAVAIDLGSTGEMHGFELKVSRNDWRNEIRKPEKWLGAAEIVDRYWLVAGCTRIYKDDEVPESWGIIAPDGDGRLTIMRPAPRLTPHQDPPAPWPRHIIQNVLARTVAKDLNARFASKLEKDAEARGYKRGFNAGQRRVKPPVVRTPRAAPARPASISATEPRKRRYDPARANLDDGLPLDLP